MLRAKRSTSGTDAAGGVRARLIDRAERKLAQAKNACNGVTQPVYDFRPQMKQLEAHIEDLRSGAPVQVPRSALPRDVLAAWPRDVRLFNLRGDEDLEPTQPDGA